ncbi:MAG: type II toxin-antitoxin system mRNA interferase toxin, RelE/StbE family [Candidatus Micrarchaeota archaeon]
MEYQLAYTDEFKKDVKKLDASMKPRVKKAIEKIIQEPTRFKPLEHKANTFRVRFSVYRLIYKVEKNTILLLRLGKRDDVYDD